MSVISNAISLCMIAVALAPASAVALLDCPAREKVAVQVLGSGGPIADDNRASAAYLVWIDGASRALIDVGGGAFLRFGEAGASFEDLDFIGLSHFHTDHSADLPALLKSGYFSDRTRPLPVAGPGAKGPFPGLSAFLSSLLDSSRGAYAYLAGYQDGSGGLVKLEEIEVPVDTDGPLALDRGPAGRFAVDALHVPHGIVPALAFRLRIADKVIVFASDQNGGNPAFIDFAGQADLLVMHMAIPQDADPTARRLHATPETIGTIAESVGTKTLLLSHFMARSLRTLDRNVGIVRTLYAGRIVVAEDLACVSLLP